MAHYKMSRRVARTLKLQGNFGLYLLEPEASHLAQSSPALVPQPVPAMYQNIPTLAPAPHYHFPIESSCTLISSIALRSANGWIT